MFEVVIFGKNQGCCDFVLRCVVVVLRGDQVCSLRVGLQLVCLVSVLCGRGRGYKQWVAFIGSVESCVVTGKGVWTDSC